MAFEAELQRALSKDAALVRAQQSLEHAFERIDRRIDVIAPRAAEIRAKFAAGELVAYETAPNVFEIEAE